MRTYFRMAIVAAVVFPGVAVGQTMEPAKDCQPGDKASYTWVLNNKPQQLDLECTEGSDQEVHFVQKVGGRNFEGAAIKGSLRLVKAMCLANGQQCAFSPGLDFIGLPLQKGKKWTQTFTVTGETFTAEVTQERKAERLEKVKVPAGEFEAFKVSFSGRIKGVDSKGNPFSGKEDGTDWFALINGKISVVKTVYRNSFGEKASQELTAAAFQ
jgi:hypothetical protein